MFTYLNVIVSVGSPAVGSPIGLLSPSALSTPCVFTALQRLGCEALTMLLAKSIPGEADTLLQSGFTIGML